MKRFTFIVLSSALLASPIYAEDLDEGPGGDLNPEEMTINRAVEMARRGKVDMTTCAMGYVFTKMGSHVEARDIFEQCAAAGYTATMSWMAYMETNGFGDAENPEKAAQWDRKAAELGDPIGQLNYGLDLLRGHGVARNDELGRQYIDKAAQAGIRDAIDVQNSGYDWNAATPDADNWRYEKRVF